MSKARDLADNAITAAADRTKIDAIEAAADVTDATNVTTAGALMDSEVTNLTQVKAFDTTTYATAAQGTLGASALQPTGDGSALTGLPPALNNVFSQAISTSQTYTVETTGTLVIQAIGGGGSGGATQVSTVASSGCATGGGGGGYSYKTIDVEIGDELVIVIGAGGAAKSYSVEPLVNSVGDALSGNSGGNTTVVGSNIGSANATVNIAANGGGGGNSARAGSYDIALTATASIGGTATGGDLNYAGGTSIAKTSDPLVNSGILVSAKSVGQASGGGGVANLLTPAAVSRTFGEFGISADGDATTFVTAVSSDGTASVIKFSSLTVLSGAGAAMVSSAAATRTAAGGSGTRGGGGGGAVGLAYDSIVDRREPTSGAGGTGIVLLDLFAAI